MTNAPGRKREWRGGKEPSGRARHTLPPAVEYSSDTPPMGPAPGAAPVDDSYTL